MEHEPLNALPPFNLFGVANSSYERARIVVLPVPYDATASYLSGSRFGPSAIIQASRFIEPFSYELGFDISKLGIYTMPELMPDYSSPENMLKSVKKEVLILLDENKIPIILGGDHTVSLGALMAFKEKGTDFSIVQFDAHSDTYEELNATRYSHASVIARARELYSDVFQVGIRSIDENYFRKIDKHKTLFIDDIREMGTKKVGELLKERTKNSIYVTFDFDVLDPSEMPSVGTPEPNGLHFSEILDIFKELSKGKLLVGADFTEFMPIPYLHAPDFEAAKLIYLFMGLFLSKHLKEGKK